MDYEIILTVLMGIGLSASSGFRIFIPFLLISIAALTGYLSLSDSFSWIGTYPALITFSVAVILEIAAYYIPWVDNFLDTIASPIAVIAGIVLMASVITGISPLLKWALAIIAGGGVAATIQSLTGIVRATSSVTTGGIGNSVVSSIELGGSVVMAIAAMLVPVIAFAVVVVLTLLSLRFLFKKINQN
ncbi:MAG: DUF4126 domain-containing protein [Ignavibacteria bacterium]|nr:DUF4126 domain-containing protein [Ignavibacteria bacterium]